MKDSPFKDNQYFELEDGSASFSLAIPPLLKPSRKIDIIFILDYSNNTPEPNITELQKAFAWAKKNNKPFQDITKYPNLSTSSMTIMDENKNAPIMVYMPLVKDPNLNYTGDAEKFDLKKCMSGECEQTNYKYTAANFNGLWNLAEQNITLNQDKIETVLKSASDRIEDRPWYQGSLFGTTN